MPKSPEAQASRANMNRVCPAICMTAPGRLMPFSWSRAICQASRSTKESLTISPGWRFTGKPGMCIQLSLPELLSTFKGVRTRRLKTTLKKSISFQVRWVNSSMSTEDRKI